MSTKMIAPSGVLILHGWTNRRPTDHWQHHLANSLRELNIPVEYPQLEDPDEPTATVWDRQAMEGLFALPAGHRVVVAHSAGVWTAIRLILGAHRTHNALPVDRLLIVAPVSAEKLVSIPELAAFHPEVDDREIRKALGNLPRVELVVSDNDDYFPAGAADWGNKIGVRTHELSDQGHISPSDGYGAWPSVLDWVLGRSDKILPNQ